MNNAKKKILFVHNTLSIGGIERALISLLNSINYNAVEVDLVITSFGDTLLDEINPNVSISFYTNKLERFLVKKSSQHKIDPYSVWTILFKAYLKIFIHAREARIVRRLFINEKENIHYDVAFALNQGFVHDFLLHNISADKKYAFYHHGDIKEFSDHLDTFLSFDGIIVVSNVMKALITSHYAYLADRLYVMHNIIAIERIMALSKEEVSISSSLNNFPIFVSCGRLDPAKGFDLLIDAANTLTQKYGQRFMVLIVGDGNEKNNLMERIKSYQLERIVQLLGARKNPYPYIKACHVYVQPSRIESYGLSIVEAQVLGKPVIATRTNGAQENIVDGKTGILCGLNETDLAEAMGLLMSNESLRKHIEGKLSNNDISIQNVVSMNVFYGMVYS